MGTTTRSNGRHTRAEQLLYAGKRAEAEQYVGLELTRTDLTSEERASLRRTRDWIDEAAPTLKVPAAAVSAPWGDA